MRTPLSPINQKVSHRDLIYCRQFSKCKFCFSQNDKPGSNYEKATVAQAKRIMKPFLLRRLKKDVSILEIENASKIYFCFLFCLVFILVKYALNLSPVLWFMSHYTDLQSGFLSHSFWDKGCEARSESVSLRWDWNETVTPCLFPLLSTPRLCVKDNTLVETFQKEQIVEVVVALVEGGGG